MKIGKDTYNRGMTTTNTSHSQKKNPTQDIAEREARFLTRHAQLNPAQRKAVDTTDGPLLVVAGPGSGKTEILSMRVAEILRKTHALPSNILCLTFTDSAAHNMRERLVTLVGDRAYQVAIHTFHNFCVDIIRKHGEFFYHHATFSPVDPVTQVSILERILNESAHNNPLRSSHPEKGFIFLDSIRSLISNAKRSGLRPFELRMILEDNEQGIERINEVFGPLFDATLKGDTVARIRSALATFIDSATPRPRTPELDAVFKIFHPIEESFVLSLTEALAKVDEEGRNKVLSDWKKKWFIKNDEDRRVFKDLEHIGKMKSFVDIYEAYQHELYLRGYFDFDDMIIDVISGLEREPRLRFELQEQFQYILVDEFQDTNNAQMRILSLLTSAGVHEGRPNIMVVGDDDQAIYKFQGAELSNILDFQHRYIDVGLVTMTENYRSTQGILDVAMKIIRKGAKRLENLIPDLSKELVSKGKTPVSEETIQCAELETTLHEYTYVSRKIKELIAQGHSPEDIAVIARKHEPLTGLVPFLRAEQVPIKYEREQNIFLEPHIKELITMVTYIASAIPNTDTDRPRDDLLPEILSYAFWNIPRIEIWKLSVQKDMSNMTWLERMTKSSYQPIVDIAHFFIELSVDAKSTPLELIIDKLVGAHTPLVPQEVSEEFDEGEGEGEHENGYKNEHVLGGQSSTGTIATSATHTTHTTPSAVFVSPFKEYYFSKEKFSHARAEYLSFLSSLRVFISALRNFNGFDEAMSHVSGDGSAENVASDSHSSTSSPDLHTPNSRGSRTASRFRTLKVEDLVRFVEIYEKNNISLNDESPFVTARNAVSLMTAHKSKGLEFKTVFVLSCKDAEWAGNAVPNKISLPINLPIMPAGDGEDDRLRLFYVALTRARQHLYLTSHEVTNEGKEAGILRFLVDALSVDHHVSAEEIARIIVRDPHTDEMHTLLETASMSYRSTPFLDTEHALLTSLLEQYQLSVTHLNNYLNIPKGGPRLFFEQNLLRFPQSKSPSGAFGTAIHDTLEFSLNDFKKQGVLPALETVLETFVVFLQKEKIRPADYALFKQKGIDALTHYYPHMVSTFHKTDIPELDFSRDHVVIDDTYGVRVSGKIDRVAYSDEGIEVIDYKTGKPFDDFDATEEYIKVKSYQYQNQLLFYRLLIEHSSFDQKNLYSADGEKMHLKHKKVIKGTIDFIEPPRSGHNKRVVSIHSELSDDAYERLKKLAIIVYKRIKNLEFDIPKEIAEQKFSSDIKAIHAFEEYLLASEQD
jgi:DNA helicase II / ATP-dependent DNA helicase PcrA